MGSYAFNAQYLQDPQLGDSDYLAIGDLHLVDELPDLELFVRRVQSWDTASKDGPNCAYSACVTAGWHRDEERWYLLDVYRDRLGYPALKDRVIAHKRHWRAERVLIEDAAMGVSLIQDLRNDGHRWCHSFTATEGKLERFLPVTGWLKDGRLTIPTSEPWFDPFRRELLAFPHVTYKDQVDSLVQFMHWVGRRGDAFLDTDPKSGRRLGKYRPTRGRRR